jgi:hypothetical protein
VIAVDDGTLRGYETVHGRPPAFEGCDGLPYTAGVFSADAPGPDGRYGAAIIFVRWSPTQEPEGHLETEFLAFDPDPLQAEDTVGRLTLLHVKGHLDRMIVANRRAGAP